MNFLKNVFGKKDEPIRTYADFWNWFQKNEKDFFKVVNSYENVEEGFFNKISPRLNELKEGFFYLAGMHDDHTAELVITPDGVVRNIVFVEELVQSAPKIKGWKFTPLKPALPIENVSIEMSGYKFDKENLSFYPNDSPGYPDEIDIVLVHHDLTEENKPTITNGIYIFLDNYLGELNFATTIDNLTVTSKKEAQKELIPIEKLKDFLIWRQKEFIEKYEGIRHNTENDHYAGLEAELEDGKPLVAIINTDLLKWDSKASHPWVLKIEVSYDGKENNGMPDEETYGLLDEIENKVMEQLKDFEGYLNIGRQTADSVREVYFACKDFRKPSKVLQEIQDSYAGTIPVTFDIYKDKYWRSFDRFDIN
jgi:hypothetical protein